MTFRLESPWLLGLLVPILFVILWKVVAPGRHRPAGLHYSDTGLAANLARPWRLAARGVLPMLRYLVLVLMVLAIARPQLGQTREIIKGEGVDIGLALDISGSMASLDFEPHNRLEAAKEVIANFIEERRFDRIGLVVFAQNAFNQSPPTVDHKVLSRLLDETELATDLGIEDGTAIGMGLANAANMLKDSTTKSKVVILLTDGVNNAGQIDPQTAAEAAGTLGIKVYTIGVGRPGIVAVPVVDAFGRRSVVQQESALDEATLRDIADTTGGLYFRAEDTAGLQRIYDEINDLEKSQIEVDVYSRYRELAGWLILPALLLILLEVILRRTLLKTIP